MNEEGINIRKNERFLTSELKEQNHSNNQLVIHTPSKYLKRLKTKLFLTSSNKNEMAQTSKKNIISKNLAQKLLNNFKKKVKEKEIQLKEDFPFRKSKDKVLHNSKETKNGVSMSERLYSQDLKINSASEHEYVKSEENLFTDLKKFKKKTKNEFSNTSRDRTLFKFLNVYDSFSDEEIIEMSTNFAKIIIMPHSRFKKIWESFMIVIIFYSCLTSPFYLINHRQLFDTIFYHELILEVIFIIDMLFHFFYAIRRENDNIIKNLNYIFLYYIFDYFLLDLFSCFPNKLIQFLYFKLNSGRISEFYIKNFLSLVSTYSLMNWFSCVRIFKLMKYSRIMDYFFFKNLKINRIFKSVILFMYIIHFTSCFWIYAGTLNPTISWINSNMSDDNSIIDLYIASVYYHLVTMYTIGYGDITPTNSFELVYTNILLFFGIMLFSYALSSLSTLFSLRDEVVVNYNKKKRILHELSTEYNIGKHLKHKIKIHLVRSLKDDYAERNSFLENLPTIIKNQLTYQMYKVMIEHFKFFQNQSYDFIISILPLFKSHCLHKNQVLFSVGEIVEEMYLVVKGSLSINLGEIFSNYEIGIVRENHHFGDIFLQTNENSLYELSCKSRFTEVFVLQKKDFLNLKVDHYPNILKILKLSFPVLETVEKRRKLFLNLFKIYNSVGAVNLIMRKLNIFFMERDFEGYYEHNFEFEDVNDFIFKNDLNRILNLLNMDFFNDNKFKNVLKKESKNYSIITGTGFFSRKNSGIHDDILNLSKKSFIDKTLTFKIENKKRNQSTTQFNSNISNTISPINGFNKDFKGKDNMSEIPKRRLNSRFLQRMSMVEKFKEQILNGSSNLEILKEENDINEKTLNLIYLNPTEKMKVLKSQSSLSLIDGRRFGGTKKLTFSKKIEELTEHNKNSSQKSLRDITKISKFQTFHNISQLKNSKLEIERILNKLTKEQSLELIMFFKAELDDLKVQHETSFEIRRPKKEVCIINEICFQLTKAKKYSKTDINKRKKGGIIKKEKKTTNIIIKNGFTDLKKAININSCDLKKEGKNNFKNLNLKLDELLIKLKSLNNENS